MDRAYLELLLVQPVENVACAVSNLGVCQSAFDCFLSEAVVQRVWWIEDGQRGKSERAKMNSHD